MSLSVTQTGSFTTSSKQPLDKQREIEQHVLTREHFLQKSPLTKEVGEGRLPRVKSQESSFLRHVWNSRAVKASSKTSQKSGTKRWPPKTNTSLDLGARSQRVPPCSHVGLLSTEPGSEVQKLELSSTSHRRDQKRGLPRKCQGKPRG